MAENKEIFCVGCADRVQARLTDGSEIYPHRQDLFDLPFWKCDKCNNYVGCHHKTKARTKPLGNIPTPKMRNARKHIHAIIDPIWQSGKMSRKEVYEEISELRGRPFHTANLKTIEDARDVYRFAQTLIKRLNNA